MKSLVVLLVMFASGDVYGQSILDALRQPTTNADFEALNQANQASQNSFNAVAKRANLLQRRAEELRLQVSRLENEVERLRAEQAELKTVVIECRVQVVAIIELLEKRDFNAIAVPLDKLKATYSKSLLPMLLVKEPTAETDPAMEAPVVANPAPPSSVPPAAPQPTEPPQPPTSQPPAPQLVEPPQPAKPTAVPDK